MDTGIPLISALPLTELLRFEYPDLIRLTGLIRLAIIDLK
jgi:hypothetical protein